MADGTGAEERICSEGRAWREEEDDDDDAEEVDVSLGFCIWSELKGRTFFRIVLHYKEVNN